MRYVSSLQYARMLEAREYYEERGYKFVDVPWAVGREAILLTRPPFITNEPFSFVAGGQTLYPVASAEQSFIQMQMDALASASSVCQCSFAFPMSAEAMAEHIKVVHSSPIVGSYCAMTPCFRNEPKLDDQHQPYFFKMELIRWVESGTLAEQEIALHRMISHAREFFEYEDPQFATETILNEELSKGDPIGVGGHAFDIVSLRGQIEIGSYGIRQHPSVGRWIYGTGLAEPRYSYALEVEHALNTSGGNA